MKNTTNAVHDMLSLYASHTASGSGVVGNAAHSDACLEEEHGLHELRSYTKNFDHNLATSLEEYIERLQETFLEYVAACLRENNITMNEKLIVSLLQDNTLLLQSQEAEDALLSALGTDSRILEQLVILRKAAFLSRGLQYLLAAEQEFAPNSLPQYKVCIKGQLSHFYLKHD